MARSENGQAWGASGSVTGHSISMRESPVIELGSREGDSEVDELYSHDRLSPAIAVTTPGMRHALASPDTAGSARSKLSQIGKAEGGPGSTGPQLKTESPASAAGRIAKRVRATQRAPPPRERQPRRPLPPTKQVLARKGQQRSIRKMFAKQAAARSVELAQDMEDWCNDPDGEQDFFEYRSQRVEAGKPNRTPAVGSYDRKKTPYETIHGTHTLSSRGGNWIVHRGGIDPPC